MQITTTRLEASIPEAAKYYKTARCIQSGRYCSIQEFDKKENRYLVNFGHIAVWMDAAELDRFSL